LWSHVFTVFFLTLALLIIVRYSTGKTGNLHPVLLGILLMSGYLCRPVSAVFVVVVLGYVFVKDKRDVLKASATVTVLFLGFVSFSFMVFGKPLPDYYMPQRLSSESYWTALYGLLFSPSRGVFIFSPMVLVVLVGSAFKARLLGRRELFWLSVAWAAGSVLVIAKFPAWYGGHSFGPRLQVDFFVAFVLITFLLWNVIEGHGGRAARNAVLGLYLATGVFAIWIHSYQGLFNFWPHKWNALQEVPGMSANQLMFDWRHPQILATPESILGSFQRHFSPDRYIVDVVDKERD
jgi:hypothetical protein